MSRLLPPARIEFDERYVLRPVEPGDVDQIVEALQASLPDLKKFMVWAHHPTDREQFLERVLIQHAKYFKGSEYELALFDIKTGEFLAYTCFSPVARINPQCLEIGFWTSSLHAGKGYATLATQVEIAVLFDYFKSDRIEITCNIENQASRRVIEKCGFQFEGELRNFYPKGTLDMFAAGYTPERRTALFSLTPEDRPHLPWYQDIANRTMLFPLIEPPRPLMR